MSVGLVLLFMLASYILGWLTFLGGWLVSNRGA